MIQVISNIDVRIVRKNIIPLFICFCAWLLSIIIVLGTPNSAITIALLVTVQFIASLNDIYRRIIPFKLTVTALCIGAISCVILYEPNVAILYFLGGITAFFITKLLVLTSKNQIGGGDLALLTVTGLFSGINSFFAILFASILLAGSYSMVIILAKRAGAKTEIPFAPFILLATTMMVIINLSHV